MMDTDSPSRHARRRQQTRRQLQQAAVALVLEKGYDSVAIQDITDRADLGRGTFYIHFHDKEDALWSAIQDGMQATEAEAHGQFSGSLPPQVEYYGYLNIFRHADQNGDLYRVMLGDKGSAHLYAKVLDHLTAEYTRDLASGTKTLYAEFVSPHEVLVQVVAGAVIQCIRWWLSTPNRYTAEEMAGMLYQSLHHQKPPVGVSTHPPK